MTAAQLKRHNETYAYLKWTHSENCICNPRTPLQKADKPAPKSIEGLNFDLDTEKQLKPIFGE